MAAMIDVGFIIRFLKFIYATNVIKLQANSKISYFYRKYDLMRRKRILVQLRNILNLKDHIDVADSINSIKTNIEFRGPNIWILFFACLIASVGLNVNAIPVIIGAMLISPLMGPILGVGLALGTNDSDLLKKSLKNFGIMVVICLIASCLYFLLTPLSMDSPTELLARTNPTIYDVLIALFGGLAGIIEVCRREKGTVISGVAIATALMPPLCTAGYGIANWNFLYFAGALYLFFINSVFIALAAYLIIRYLNFPIVEFADPAKRKRVKRTISLGTLIIIVPSIYSGIVMIGENRFNMNAREFVAENKSMDRSYIYDYSIDHHKSPSLLTVVIGGEKLSDEEIQKLYKSVEEHGIKKEQLVLEQNAAMQQSDVPDKIMISEIFERADREIKRKDERLKELETEIEAMKAKELPHEQIASEISAQHPEILSLTLSTGIEKSFTSGKSDEQILAVIKVKDRLDETACTRLKNWLKIRLDNDNIRIIQEIEN